MRRAILPPQEEVGEMRRTILLSAVAVLALMMADPVRAAGGPPTRELPLRAMLYGSTTGMQFAGSSPSVTSTFGDRCSVASNWILSTGGTGQATYLGRFAWTASHCTQIDLTTGIGTFSDGRIQYVAANGDVLDAEYEDGAFFMSSPTMVSFSDGWTITGGTGRFVGASGSGMDDGWQELVNGAPGPLGITEIGTIIF
jgi:hypothetical protein